MNKAVLLDTSVFIRLLNKQDPLHKNAKDYYQYFIKNDFILKISTISIAEYCVKGDLYDLPLKQVRVSPFNIEDAEQTGIFARIMFKDKKWASDKNIPRVLIPNDAKLFAQAHCDNDVEYYVTSDIRSESAQNLLKEYTEINFHFINIYIPWNEQFGEL